MRMVRHSRTPAALAVGMLVALVTAAAVMPGSVMAVGGAQKGSDWPCPQRKVLVLSASDLQWEGELGEASKTWRQDADIARLVELIASRRTALADASAALKAYVAQIKPAERQGKLTLVFAGLLETVNGYRASVINGIERFNRRQKARSSEIEQEGLQLSEMQKKIGSDQKVAAEYTKALELYDWNVRVFEERRQNLPIACDIPPAIDGRTFEITREIRQLMKPGG